MLNFICDLRSVLSIRTNAPEYRGNSHIGVAGVDRLGIIPNPKRDSKDGRGLERIARRHSLRIFYGRTVESIHVDSSGVAGNSAVSEPVRYGERRGKNHDSAHHASKRTRASSGVSETMPIIHAIKYIADKSMATLGKRSATNRIRCSHIQSRKKKKPLRYYVELLLHCGRSAFRRNFCC